MKTYLRHRKAILPATVEIHETSPQPTPEAMRAAAAIGIQLSATNVAIAQTRLAIAIDCEFAQLRRERDMMLELIQADNNLGMLEFWAEKYAVQLPAASFREMRNEAFRVILNQTGKEQAKA